MKVNNKRNVIIFAIAAIVLIMGAIFYFTASKYKIANTQKEKGKRGRANGDGWTSS